MAEPHFGGPWTEDKLSRLRKYLQAYMKIFSTNPRAKLLKTIYVDAFAGTGFRDTAAQISEEHSLFDVTADSDAEALRKGRTQVALETSPHSPNTFSSSTTRDMRPTSYACVSSSQISRLGSRSFEKMQTIIL